MTSLKAHDRLHLVQMIEQHMDQYGPDCSLNHIDVSNVTDMSNLFSKSDFQGDISDWDTSNVMDMSYMFLQSRFNGDISRWNTSKVTNMSSMFNSSVFTGDISAWDVSNVERMTWMFYHSVFHGDLSSWEFSRDCEYLRTDLHACSPYSAQAPFNRFHDSPLGYIGVLRNTVEFPAEHPRAALFHELRALTSGLELDDLGAARFIYQELRRQPDLGVDMVSDFTLS